MTVCVACGRRNAEHARFCQSCGSALAADEPVTATAIAAAITSYAGFWIRFAAFFIDWMLVSVAMGIVILLTSGVGLLLGLVVPWLYEALMLSGENQATLGKMALGVGVTDLDGQRLTFARATGRHFAKYLSGLVMGIGFVIAAFTPKKQALHDLIAGTVAVLK